jgi:hypothetical protein
MKITDRRQTHQEDTVRIVARYRRRDFNRQARLASACDARECQQPRVGVRQAAGDERDLACASNEGPWLRR